MYLKPKTLEGTGLPGPLCQGRERARGFVFSFIFLFKMPCVGGQVASISFQWHSRLMQEEDRGVPAIEAAGSHAVASGLSCLILQLPAALRVGGEGSGVAAKSVLSLSLAPALAAGHQC